MKISPRSMVGILLLAGGILVGRTVCLVDSAERPSSIVMHTSGRTFTSTERLQANSRNTLKSLGSHRDAAATKPNALSLALERMDVTALRRLIQEQSGELVGWSDGMEERKAKQNLLNEAMKELWRRQGIASMDWAFALEPQAIRRWITGALLERAFHENPETALPWMKKRETEGGLDSRILEFGAIALTGAIKRGADDVIDTYRLFQDSRMRIPVTDVEFPEDFDFAKLHAALGTKIDMSAVVVRWVQRDRDAAAAAVMSMGNLNDMGHYFRDMCLIGLMSGAIQRDGNLEGVRWTRDLLVSHGKEEEAIPMILGIGIPFPTEVITTLIPHTTPVQRCGYAKSMIEREGMNFSVQAMLDMLPREDLLATLKGYSSGELYPSARSFSQVFIDRQMQELEKRYQLTPEEMAMIKDLPSGAGE